MTEASIGVYALFGLVCGAALGWPLGAFAARLAGRPVPSWATSLCAAAACATAAASRAGQPLPMLAGLALALALVLLAAVDVAALRLPDVVTLPLTAVGLGLGAAATEPLVDRLVGAAVGFASLFAVETAFRRLRGRSGLGLGDAKLFAAAGAWLGWDQLPQVLLMACAVGLAWAAIRCLRSGRASLSRPIPFGLGICLGWLASWIFQGSVA